MMPPVPDERPPNLVVGPDLPLEPTTIDDLAPWKRDIAEQVKALAPKYLIHPRLALAVISVESNFDPAARSPKDAGGLMQLMPDTAARFKVRNRFKVNDNLQGGLAYLQWLLAYYRGDVKLAVAAYNAGEKAVDRYRKGKRTLEVTAQFYGVDLGDDAHDAGFDAIAAGRVAQALAVKFAQDLALTAAELHDKQVLWFREQEESYADFRRKKLGDLDFVANGTWPERF